MNRPFVNHSIDQLEEACDSAVLSGNADQLRLIAVELQHRRTPRAIELKTAVEQALRSAERADLQKPKAKSIEMKSPVGGPPRAVRQAHKRKAGSEVHTPTEEQARAIEAFTEGGSLKINAYAGTGKTSTLQMLSHATRKRGLYIAFNKSIVTDARAKFSDNVECSTIHSLAYRSTPKQYRSSSDKMTGKVNAHRLAELLKLKKPWRIDPQHVLDPVAQASLILRTLTRYMQSAEPELERVHVPHLGRLMTATPETLREVEDAALRGAAHVWDKMIDHRDPVPLGFDGYLKLWALSNPRIAADFILLDEAQDTNPVVLGVLEKQSAQMVYVGDRYQQIYEWRGAVNAMDRVISDSTVGLTQSFRFGEEIAGAASRVLKLLGEDVRLTGNPKISSTIGRTVPRTILGRTNASTFRALTNAIEGGQKPYLVGGKAEYFELLKGVQALKDGKPSSVDDFFGFLNWREVVDFSKLPEGSQLQTFVNLVETRGEKNLLWALDQTVEESDSDIVISTAHKAKGREWSKVRLMDDFLKSAAHNDDDDDPQYDRAELQLFYVAMTRAKHELEIDPTLMPLIGLKAPAPMPREEDADDSVRQFWEQKPKERQKQSPWEPPANWEPKATRVSARKTDPRLPNIPKQTVKPTPIDHEPSARKQAPKSRGLLGWLFRK